MLTKLLRNEVRKFIEEHKDFSAPEIILKYSSNKNLPIKEIAEQVECIKKAEKKLPELSKHNLLYKKVSFIEYRAEDETICAEGTSATNFYFT